MEKMVFAALICVALVAIQLGQTARWSGRRFRPDWWWHASISPRPRRPGESGRAVPLTSILVVAFQIWIAWNGLTSGHADQAALFGGSAILEVLLGFALWRRPVEDGPER